TRTPASTSRARPRSARAPAAGSTSPRSSGPSITSPREAELGGGAGIRRRLAPCAVALGGLLALLAWAALADWGAADSAGAGHPHLHVGDGRGGIAKRKLGSFDAPTYVTHAPGPPGLLYVVERAR